MSTKIRKQIYIEERQARLLKREAGARGVSEAALLRHAIDNVVPALPRGGDDPAAFDSIIRYARRRLAKAKGKERSGGSQRWTRDDIYEERLSRYGKRGIR